jgi:hypothetical protein
VTVTSAAGTTYAASAYVAAGAASAIGKSVNPVLRERDSSGTTTVREWTSTNATLTTAYQKLTLQGTLQASGDQFDLYVVQNDAATGDSFYSDAYALYAAGSGSSGGGHDAGSTGTGGAVLPVGPVGSQKKWTLAFDDEFNGTSLDTTKWAANWYDEGGEMNGVGTYAANVSVSGGNLILTRASSTSGALVNTQSNNGFAVQVGMYAEARIYFPGNGSSIYNWDAWWISGPSWPADGEHDIAEVLGGALTENYHSPSGAHNHGAPPGYWGNAFHVYGIYRQSGSAQVYWDGNLVESYSTDDNGVGENLVLNVGSGSPAAYGAASQMLVDYVRVWQ